MIYRDIGNTGKKRVLSGMDANIWTESRMSRLRKQLTRRLSMV